MSKDTPSSKLAPGKSCGCALCRTHFDFTIDKHLIEEIERYNCVIFAGAGISTEQSFTYPVSFYEQVKMELEAEDGTPFPVLMQMYEKQPNGRQKLISKIVERFEYIDSFAGSRFAATRFHAELSTMPYFDKIITTNWDRYFEDYIGATPFVYESDIPFWNVAKRAVLKIHGSIDNYASIVATTNDYEACEKRLREGAIGAVLKQIFATKTCIFLGYSAQDPDFLNIYRTIQSGLGAFSRTHYLVSPYLENDDYERLEDLNISPIRTDATFFLSTVKEHMCASGPYALDKSYDMIRDLLNDVIEEHHQYSYSFRSVSEPHLMCALFYQDGLIHAWQRISDLKRTGEYSNLHRLDHIIDGYQDKIGNLRKAKNYTDLSYFQGYMNGLFAFLMMNDPEESFSAPPFYFHPGTGEIETLEEFNAVIRANPSIHKAALAQCLRIVKNSGHDETTVPQHSPWG